jgi:hypothetical protein
VVPDTPDPDGTADSGTYSLVHYLPPVEIKYSHRL